MTSIISGIEEVVDQLLDDGHKCALALLPLSLLPVELLHPVLVDHLQRLSHLRLPLLTTPHVSLKNAFELTHLLGKLPAYAVLELKSGSAESDNFLDDGRYLCGKALHLLEEVVLN
jgi:hypothetical protein